MKRKFNFKLLTLAIVTLISLFANSVINAETNESKNFKTIFKNAPIAAAPVASSTHLGTVEVNTGPPTYDFSSYFTDDVDNSVDLEYNYDDSLVDYTTLGTYTFPVTATDSNLEVTTVDMTVEVVDTTAPTLTNSNFTVDLTESQYLCFSVENLRGLITDNYDSFDDLTIFYDDYSLDCSIPGTYAIYYDVTDFSANYTSGYLNITVQPTEFPYLTTNYFEIEAGGYSDIIFGNWLIQPYVEDTVTPSSDIVISWDPTLVDTNTVGAYIVPVTLTDSDGNSATYEIWFEVWDTEAPIILNSEVSVPIGGKVTVEMLDIFDTNPNSNKYATIDDSKVNYNVVGTYTATVNVNDNHFNSAMYTITVNVTGTLPDGGQTNQLFTVGIALLGLILVKKSFNKIK